MNINDVKIEQDGKLILRELPPDKKVKHNFKDCLFTDLFAHCEEGKQNFISLYNALLDKPINMDESDIKEIILDNVIYKGLKNDISMLVDEKIIVMVEQQSTINENMPLRMLEYVSEIYKRMYSSRSRYNYSQIPLPCPEFYVFYNGNNNYPEEKILKLSTAFILNNPEKKEQTNFPLEILVKVFNINKKKNSKLLKNCIPLAGFARIAELANYYKSINHDNPVGCAIEQCINEGILVNYLTKNSSEVKNMLLAEYDYDEDMSVKEEMGYNRGVKETSENTAINLLKLGNVSFDDIANCCSLNLERVKELASQMKK